MDKKKLIIAAVALIAVIIVVAGAAAALLMTSDNYDTLIAQGYRYLEEGDFNNAILSFQAAVEEDETRDDAYIGMYNSYVRYGRYDEALLAAREGLARTGSNLFNTLVTDIERYNNSLNNQTAVEDTQSDTLGDKKVVPVLNRDILSFFDAATFGDYNSKYGSATSRTVEGKCELRVRGLSATLIYFDTASQRVINQSNGLPYNTYLPNEIRMDNVMDLFGGVKEMDFITLKNLTGVLDPQLHDGVMTFRYAKCQITITCDTGDKINKSCANSIVPNGEYTEESRQSLKLTIQNAATGLALSDAAVKAYEGYGTVGTPIEGKTDASGNVTLSLPKSGTYTIEVIKDGFITETFEVYVLAGDTYQTLNVAPAMSGDVIRFVLTWGASPQDLDSYLFGTSSDGTRLRVCYLDKQKTDSNGNKIAELDVDDTNGFGPETITLYDNGNYEFIVADYMATGTMSYSGAQVKIYVGSSLYTTVDIPAGLENQWHVCQVVNGQITVTNRAGDISSSGGLK